MPRGAQGYNIEQSTQNITPGFRGAVCQVDAVLREQPQFTTFNLCPFLQAQYLIDLSAMQSQRATPTRN